VESPLWWTLLDEITPSELKRLYSDRSLSLARYDAAVEAGLEKPLSEKQRRRLEFYIHHGLTPELAPMWWAFDIFARERLSRTGAAEDAVPRELAGYGITSPGVETIMAAAQACAAEREELMADLGPRQIEAQRLIRHRRDAEYEGTAPPGKPILEAVNERDYELFAAVAGRPVAEIRELVDALADWEAPRLLTAECLPVLKDELSPPDWERFRRYLREVVVAPIRGLPFFDQAGAGADR
jgi:hypothetical protein